MERADISIDLVSDHGNPVITSFIFHAEDKPAALLISIDPDGSVRTEEVSGGQSIGIEMAVNRDQEFIPSQEVYETAAAAACSLLGHDSVERVMFTLLRNLLQEPLNPVWRVAFSKVNGSTVYATLDALTGEVTEVKD